MFLKSTSHQGLKVDSGNIFVLQGQNRFVCFVLMQEEKRCVDAEKKRGG